MAYSKGAGGGKLSAVDTILAEAADLVALEQIAKLNTAHLTDDAALPSSLESRFRKLKSLPTTTAVLPPVKTLGRSATAPLQHDADPADPPQPNPPAPAPAALTVQEQQPEDAPKKENSPPQVIPPATTVHAVHEEEEEDLERTFRPGRGRPTLRERNRVRDDDSPSPPRQACCFGFSPKKPLQRTPARSKKTHAAGGVGGLDDILDIGDVGEWGDENMVTELKEQQRKLKKALEEQVKVSRETAKMARWVKQASARMTHTAAIDDLLSDIDDDEDLK